MYQDSEKGKTNWCSAVRDLLYSLGMGSAFTIAPVLRPGTTRLTEGPAVLLTCWSLRPIELLGEICSILGNETNTLFY